MKFSSQTGVSIERAFRSFHKKNPKVYEHFEKLVDQAVSQGKKKLSAKMIINVIRWNVFMETTDTIEFVDHEGNKTIFRINDAYTSRYARLYIKYHPQSKDIFNLRDLRS